VSTLLNFLSQFVKLCHQQVVLSFSDHFQFLIRVLGLLFNQFVNNQKQLVRPFTIFLVGDVIVERKFWDNPLDSCYSFCSLLELVLKGVLPYILGSLSNDRDEEVEHNHHVKHKRDQHQN